MLSQNNNALGIIFPNSYDNTVPELVTERTMASIPFAGRYRMVDFILSSMSNCGITNVSIVVRKNYHSLMDHLGTGREWDMARRHGGLNIVPPFAEKGRADLFRPRGGTGFHPGLPGAPERALCGHVRRQHRRQLRLQRPAGCPSGERRRHHGGLSEDRDP